ncbi:DUF4198 domain-containing protein [Flavobacterium sp. NKUCC04_CG]|uniref:DUF4198 domain-containing protein n=1 Tax=Flavobacterium sp. NKUCC04_CG TaxID=2842121 RepID=UPI001C5B322E|nr:DUF4198 domain-containing protein [Flavobacterium sp. NKUCC04_CG]MBW3520383.1 DUF4198 domain-containing protein [Flavobacterium sp. NKUCC04_CG]
MKKILILLLLLSPFTEAFSHYLWIETPAQTAQNKQQIIKVKYGEFAYNEIEEASNAAFLKVKDFELWLIDPDGEKKELKTIANGDHYEAVYTPKKAGTYIVYLDNKKMEIVDSTQYNFGIYKPQYHAKAKINVGKSNKSDHHTNHDGLEIIETASVNQQITLQVRFKNLPLTKSKVMVFFKDGWSKEQETDEKGEITLTLPWQTSYAVEVIHIDKTPGTFNQLPYEFIWNCATYFINHQADARI